MENVRCQDGAPEALLENYRALGTVVSIIGRHLPRPAKQVPPLVRGQMNKKLAHFCKMFKLYSSRRFICCKSSGKMY